MQFRSACALSWPQKRSASCARRHCGPRNRQQSQIAPLGRLSRGVTGTDIRRVKWCCVIPNPPNCVISLVAHWAEHGSIAEYLKYGDLPSGLYRKPCSWSRTSCFLLRPPSFPRSSYCTCSLDRDTAFELSLHLLVTRCYRSSCSTYQERY